MRPIRAWQAAENSGSGVRHVSYLELDCADNVDGQMLDLRYLPFQAENPVDMMMAQAQWWSQFGVQAPLHRSVLVLRRGLEATHFGERYPGFKFVVHDGSWVVSADSAELALITRSVESGDLKIADKRLVLDPSAQIVEHRCLLEAMIELLYREQRILYFPYGKSDFRTSVPEITDIALIGPLSSRVGLLAEQVQAHGAVAGFNSGFFVFPEEEFDGDPYSFALDHVGLVVTNGELLSPPVYRRSALLFTRQTYWRPYDEAKYSLGALKPLITDIGLEHYAVKLPGGPVLHGPQFSRAQVPFHFGAVQDSRPALLNPTAVDSDDCAFYNRNYGIASCGSTATHTPLARNRIELTIVGNQICAVNDGSETFIPRNGFVVSLPLKASGQVVDAIVASNESTIEQAIDAGANALAPVFGCQVSLRLIAGGISQNAVERFRRHEEFVPYEPEKGELGIPPIHLFERYLTAANRAFIGFGIRPDHRCYVVAIEGCEPRSFLVDADSSGGSLEDLTQYLLQLGCTEGVALDSGGSGEIVFGEKSIVRPSDRNDIASVPAHRLGPGGWLVFS